MLGNFILKRLFHSKLKDVPQAEKNKLLGLIEKNPELFKTIAAEAQTRMANGKDQMSAIAETMRMHDEELRELVS